LIGTVARLRQEKNIPRLLRVFREATQNVNAKLVIVGSGEMYESILRHIQELNLTGKVIMTGYINDPSAIVKALDILAISSDTEQMPISVLEAMAAGIPVVGTDVGDIKEMIAPVNVEFLCQADDENAFVNNLKRLMDDAALRGKIGLDNNVRSRANFDKQLMFDNYEKLYELAI
jgi:L-malate glycosyltransferase